MTLEVGARRLREQRVAQQVLLRARQLADLLAVVLERLVHEVGRPHVDGLLVAEHALDDLARDGSRGGAVPAAQVGLHLVRHDVPAAPGEHVEHGLRADDLRHRRDQRREADLGAHDRDLLEHLGQTVEGVLLRELALEVADHAARHLVRVHLHVRERGDAAVVAGLDAHALEVLGDA